MEAFTLVEAVLAYLGIILICVEEACGVASAGLETSDELNFYRFHLDISLQPARSQLWVPSVERERAMLFVL